VRASRLDELQEGRQHLVRPVPDEAVGRVEEAALRPLLPEEPPRHRQQHEQRRPDGQKRLERERGREERGAGVEPAAHRERERRAQARP
jgi:hypothetical protein